MKNYEVIPGLDYAGVQEKYKNINFGSIRIKNSSKAVQSMEFLSFYLVLLQRHLNPLKVVTSGS